MKSLYKILMSGAFGNYFFVTYASTPEHAKELCWHYSAPTEKIIKEPVKTTKTFIAGTLPVGTIQSYWRIVVA